MKEGDLFVNKLDVTIKKNIKVGMYVELTSPNREKGLILKVLSRKDNQSGIKVELTSGVTGNIKEVYTLDKIKLENFKFYNRFIYEPFVYSIWDKETRTYLIINYKHHSISESYFSVFLSDNKEDILEIIETLKLDKKRYIVNRIKNKESVSKSFINISDIEMVLIKNEKYLRFSKFLEIEMEIKSKTEYVR